MWRGFTFPLGVLLEVSRFLQGSRVFYVFPQYSFILEVDRVDYRCKHQTKSDNCIVGTVLSMTVRADSGLAFARPLVRCHVEVAATAINSTIMATILSCPQYFLYVNATNASVRASYYRHLFGLSDPPIAPYLLSTRAAHGRCRRGR